MIRPGFGAAGAAALLALLTLASPIAIGKPASTSSRVETPAWCARAIGVQALATIVNTRDPTYHCLGLSLDARDGIRTIRIETHDIAASTADGGPVLRDIRVREIAPAELATARGAVLDGEPGHDAVILKGRIGPDASSANLVVSYLYNGISGEFRECPLRLARTGDAVWHLRNARGEDVSRILVKTWGLPVIGTVGIATLEGLCPEG